MVLIVDDLLALPFRLGGDILEQFVDQVDEETLGSVGAVRRRIMHLQIAFEQGEMDEQEYREQMNDLRVRLKTLEGD